MALFEKGRIKFLYRLHCIILILSAEKVQFINPEALVLMIK